MSSQVAPDILPEDGPEEMVDFTCATPWERLSLDIELQMRAWRVHCDALDGAKTADYLCVSSSEVSSRQDGTEDDRENPGARKNDISSRLSENSEVHSARLAFGSRALLLQLHERAPANIASLLGLRKCIVLASGDEEERPIGAAHDASDASSLLSALVVAAGDCRCPLPLIVQIGSLERCRLVGRQVYPRQFQFCCDFTLYPSPALNHLPGLLQLFHNKRVAALRYQPPSRTDALISAEFKYYWSDFSFQVAQPPFSFANDPVLTAMHKIPLSDADPVPYLLVSAIWKSFHASSLHEHCNMSDSDGSRTMRLSTATLFRLAPPNDVAPYSTLTGQRLLPLTSPVRASLRMAHAAEKSPQCSKPVAPRALVDTRSYVVSRCNMPLESQSAPALSSGPSICLSEQSGLSDHANRGRDQASAKRSRHVESRDADNFDFEFSCAFDTFMAKASVYISSAVVENDKIDDEYLSGSLAAVFNHNLSHGLVADVADALGPSASHIGLVERCARLVAAAPSLVTAQILWNLFLDAIDLHWVSRRPLKDAPFDPVGGPDLGECLLVQKIQMVNCCIDRIRIQESDQLNSATGRKARIPGMQMIGSPGVQREENGSSGLQTYNSSCGGEIWQPYVLPLPLVTRDIVEAEQDRIVSNADKTNSSESPTDCSRRQVCALRSDMMAFKAANPGSSLSDFVRWFSPRDWVSDISKDPQVDVSTGLDESSRAAVHEPLRKSAETEKGLEGQTAEPNSPMVDLGHLSGRMSSPGNAWQEMWRTAEPVPAAKQTPLFDAELHGMKALTDLRYMPFVAVLQQLACVLSGCSIRILQNAFDRPPIIRCMKSVVSDLRALASAANIQRPGSPESLAAISECCDKIAAAEHMALVASSLVRKLPPGDEFVSVIDGIVCNDEVELSSHRDRVALSLVAGLEEGGWRTPLSPSYREFILEGSNGDRMYVMLSSDEMRVGCRLNAGPC